MTDANGRSMPEGSPILAMHGRYEKAWDAYNTLDEERCAADDSARDSVTGRRYERLLRRLQAETDLLRAAILHQTPLDPTDAMVMLFHAATLSDMRGGDEKQAEVDRQLLDYGLSSVLDFMACTVPQDHERIGAQFQKMVGNAFNARHLANGDIEGQELTEEPGDWTTALAAYRAATAAVAVGDAEVIGEPAFDALVDVATAALKTLLAIPAPNSAAFATKLEIIDVEGFHEAKEVWPQILTEARHLGPA